MGRGVGLGDPQRALPTLTMLGFCEPVLTLGLGGTVGAVPSPDPAMAL